MAFSESLKKEIRIKSFHLCCVCKSFGVDIHHIIPKSENGPDNDDNAAPLCAKCHDLYGDNPNKRKQIKEARDLWFDTCKDMYTNKLENMNNYFVTNDKYDQLKQEVEELKEKINLQPQNKRLITTKIKATYLTEAKLFIINKNFDKAKEILLKEVTKNPASDEGWSMLGKLYSEEGDIPKMLEAFYKSISLSKKYEQDIKEYRKYNWATSFNKGVSFFNSAVKTTKQDSMNLLFEKAVEQFKYSIMCEPDSTIGYENIVAAYLNMGKKEVAIPILEKLTKIGKPAYSFSRLGALYLIKGADLMDSYRISKNSADSVKAFEWYNKAISVLEIGRAKFPNDTDILLQLGNAYYSADKIDVAASSFRDLVEKNPANKEIRYAYGVVLLKGRKYTEAASQLEQVVKMDENNIDACYNLAATYINWGNDLRDEALIKENNDKSFQEKFKLAVPLLERYLSVKPNESKVWISLGQVYANLGIEDKSKAAFEKADEYI